MYSVVHAQLKIRRSMKCNRPHWIKMYVLSICKKHFCEVILTSSSYLWMNLNWIACGSYDKQIKGQGNNFGTIFWAETEPDFLYYMYILDSKYSSCIQLWNPFSFMADFKSLRDSCWHYWLKCWLWESCIPHARDQCFPIHSSVSTHPVYHWRKGLQGRQLYQKCSYEKHWKLSIIYA